MATGWVETILVEPHPFVSGNVNIKNVQSNEKLHENITVAAASTILQGSPYNLSKNAADTLIQRGRENRGRIKGVGYVQTYESNPI